jgi:hypothetical protein
MFHGQERGYWPGIFLEFGNSIKCWRLARGIIGDTIEVMRDIYSYKSSYAMKFHLNIPETVH